MVSSKNPKLESKSSSCNGKSAYHVGGIQVEFPYKPYGTQFAFMSKVISTLDRAVKEGHCHALLESPTGTGKSLSLLCSVLAWQKNYQLTSQYGNLTQSKPNPGAVVDPFNHGGGFIPESQPPFPINSDPAQPTGSNKNQKKKNAPTIYYASRTHSQISQVIREYRKTSYRAQMAVLASRKHYCTNARVYGKENLDEECKLLLKDRDGGCLHFKNAIKVKAHPSLKKGGCHEVHDIEDLLRVGQVVEGCPYYAARAMAEEAQLVFCPYNYIINPVIRGAMEVDIKGAIIILDEAHNIEDIAREAGSMDLEEDTLRKLQMELEQLSSIEPFYEKLFDIVEGLGSWIELRKPTLEKRDFQTYCSCWTGDRAVKELHEANISQKDFPELLDCATKAIKASTDTETEVAHLSGLAVLVLEGLFCSLTYFFSRNGNESHTSDYQLALRAKKVGAGWSYTMSLWCLNPAVVFRDIAKLSLSVILTSGTLSPVNSFSSELGVQFGTFLEAPHVIDIESQVFTSIVTTGAGNYPLNASYKTADAYEFQDALGKTLEEICKVVPAGALVFFPSYKLMEKLCTRWRETKQWQRLNARKSLFVETRAGSQDDFDHMLKGYYASLQKSNKSAAGKKKVNKMDPDHPDESQLIENPKKDGAGFLAVCRGKLSEGIDFSDDNARMVIIVGIPFPNINDIQVSLKKTYNDKYKKSKKLLSGNEWYCQQAFRALNQAAGRCIRHRFDYGAILLLDERFQEERNRIYISKWLRNSIQEFDNFEMSLEKLDSFFSGVKERIGKKMENLSPSSDTTECKTLSNDQTVEFTKKKILDTNMADHCKPGVGLVSGCNGTFSNLKSQADGEFHEYGLMDKDIDGECSVPEVNSEEDLRTVDSSSMEFCHELPEISTVKETTDSIRYDDQVSFSSNYLANQCKTPQRWKHSAEVTPTKALIPQPFIRIEDMESTFSSSVTSHTQKRRRSISSPAVDLTEEHHDSIDTQIPCSLSFTRNSMANSEAACRIQFGYEQRILKSNSPWLPVLNSTGVSSSSSGSCMDKNLQISCSLCSSPLGLPENNLDVKCSITSSSKSHLVSLMRGISESTSTCVSIVMADISSVDQRLFLAHLKEAAQGQDFWCQEDGCVFSTIFCPFCSSHGNSLGVKIMATDASNVHLLNKILFFFDRLRIQNTEETKENQKCNSMQVSNSRGMDRAAALDAIDRFSYSPQQNSQGWRSTREKLRLPKKRS